VFRGGYRVFNSSYRVLMSIITSKHTIGILPKCYRLFRGGYSVFRGGY